MVHVGNGNGVGDGEVQRKVLHITGVVLELQLDIKLVTGTETFRQKFAATRTKP